METSDSLGSEMKELFNASDTLRNILAEANQPTPVSNMKIDTEKAALQKQIDSLQKEMKAQAAQFSAEKDHILKQSSGSGNLELQTVLQRNEKIQEERKMLKNELETHGLLVVKMESALEEILVSKQQLQETASLLQNQLDKSNAELENFQQIYTETLNDSKSNEQMAELDLELRQLTCELQDKQVEHERLNKQLNELKPGDTVDERLVKIEKTLRQQLSREKQPNVDALAVELKMTAERLAQLESSVKILKDRPVTVLNETGSRRKRGMSIAKSEKKLRTASRKRRRRTDDY